MTRTERQKEGVKKWIKNGCKGTLEWCTGVGKTRGALVAIKAFIEKNPGKQVLIIVPTANLKDQWVKELVENDLFMGVQVEIINTAIKHKWNCGLLVLDEIHVLGADTFKKIFECASYAMVLGLTATMERLDGKHTIIQKYCPIIDTISIGEATRNGWLSPYKEYMVFVEVDLTEYLDYNKKFLNHFSFFNYDFNLAMKCGTGKDSWQNREAYLREIMPNGSKQELSDMRKIIAANAFGFVSMMAKRKEFIYNHPKKIEITELILRHRPNSKAITFSPTIKIAEKIKVGYTCHSKQTKSKRKKTLEEFCLMDSGVLNSSKALDVGADIPGLNLAVVLSNTSSSTQKTQRIGRVIRFSENKTAEVFTLVLKGTVEHEWFKKSMENKTYITIDEEELIKVLNGEDFQEYASKEKQVMIRF